MVRPIGFEPTAHGFGDHCSIHLSYGRKTYFPIISISRTKSKWFFKFFLFFFEKACMPAL